MLGQLATKISEISLAQLKTSRQHTLTTASLGMAQNPRRGTQIEVLIMNVVLSSGSPNGPSITHYTLTKLGVCVPLDWSTTQAIDYAESKLHCLNNYHWTTDNETDEHTIKQCELQHGFKHLTLTMEPNSNTSTKTCSTLLVEPTINARVIINIENTHADNILRTADSIQLLSQYLQLKAAAAKARSHNHYDEASKQEALAEQLNSRLLAQFEGTLVFVH